MGPFARLPQPLSASRTCAGTQAPRISPAALPVGHKRQQLRLPATLTGTNRSRYCPAGRPD